MTSTHQKLCNTSLVRSTLADYTAILRDRYHLLAFDPPYTNFILFYKDPNILPYIHTYFAPNIDPYRKVPSRPYDKQVDSKRSHEEYCPIILAQTDTTAGFLSSSPSALNHIKCRPNHQAVLRTFASLHYVAQAQRIPKLHRSFVRRASRVSFILPSKKSFRVVKDPMHKGFLRYFGALYSTSANRTKQLFSLDFALQAADIIALDSRGFYEAKPSRIYKLSRVRKTRVR